MGYKKNKSKTLGLIIVLLIIFGIFLIFNSKEFEQDSPEISGKDRIFWNVQSPINLNFKDDSGIKSVKISLSDGKNEIPLFDQKFKNIKQNLDISLNIPQNLFLFEEDKQYTLDIQAVDSSKWNFFLGNKIDKKINLIIDKTKPQIDILSNSYSIARGGAAAVVFKASDSRLKDLFIKTNFGKFKPSHFIKDDYYMAIIAWPATETTFRAEIIASDYAGNISRSHIKYYYENTKYKKSKINLKDSFLDGKINDIARIYSKDGNSLSRIEKLKFVNEILRKENYEKVKFLTNNTDDNVYSSFSLTNFYPLKNAKKVADFADHRFYLYQGNEISDSWHLGVDLASIKNASIVSSNAGKVVFASENGIYGLNVIIDHGYGIYSLYGHCSKLNVKKGDFVKAGQKIANTGSTGLALGDHLHFEILVQGVKTKPQEFMDKKWIRDRIIQVVSQAKKLIDQP